jgi:thymidylate synthase
VGQPKGLTRHVQSELIVSMNQNSGLKMKEIEGKRSIVDRMKLPEMFPTHRHSPKFWEQLGRTIATFGFLEEVLGKAIFAFTGTRNYSEEEIDAAYQAWLPQLERALSDQLGKLAETYGKAVRDNPDATIENIKELVEDLKNATEIRNVLCHGSWRTPDENDASVPLFINRKNEKFRPQLTLNI